MEEKRPLEDFIEPWSQEDKDRMAKIYNPKRHIKFLYEVVDKITDERDEWKAKWKDRNKHASDYWTAKKLLETKLHEVSCQKEKYVNRVQNVKEYINDTLQEYCQHDPPELEDCFCCQVIEDLRDKINYR